MSTRNEHTAEQREAAAGAVITQGPTNAPPPVNDMGATLPTASEPEPDLAAEAERLAEMRRRTWRRRPSRRTSTFRPTRRPAKVNGE